MPSTPIHAMLYKLLKWEAPTFCHLPLLIKEDGTKLSKRDEDISILGLKNSGYLPSAILNYVATLGMTWAKTAEQEAKTLNELASLVNYTPIL